MDAGMHDTSAQANRKAHRTENGDARYAASVTSPEARLAALGAWNVLCSHDEAGHQLTGAVEAMAQS
jgi:hypothetical protein